MRVPAAASLCLFGLAILAVDALAAFALVTWLIPPSTPAGWGWAIGVGARLAFCLFCGFGISGWWLLALGPEEGRLGRSAYWLLAAAAAVLLAAYLEWQTLQSLTVMWRGWPLPDMERMSWLERIPLAAIPLAWCATWAIDVTRRRSRV